MTHRHIEGLTPGQTLAFTAEIERLGLNASAVEEKIDTAASHDGMVIGGENSSLETQTLVVQTLAELRAEIGSEDARGVSYPPAVSDTRMADFATARHADDVWQLLTAGERENLIAARSAYLHGEPSLAATYEALLERTHMPQQVLVHAAEHVVVQPGKPLVFRGEHPISATYASVTVLPGGQILCETEVKIKTQLFKTTA